MPRLPRQWCFLLTCSALFGGCHGGPVSIEAPRIDSASVAKAAIGKWDSDRDGHLSEKEAADCPGLAHAFKQYDKDGDGLVSSLELSSRVQSLFSADVGMFSLGCTVMLDNRPLQQAEVKLVPEACFGDSLKPASGVTRESGWAMLSIAAEDLPVGLQGVRGVNAGLYRVEITHPTISLPAHYNSQTTLGREVSQDDQLNGLRFTLTSR